MPCWDKKSIKIHPKSITKQLSNQHPNLHRFWSQLGSILGGFWGSRWGQVGSKWLQKSIKKTINKMITFWIASRSILGGFWAPTWPPRGETNLRILDHISLLRPSWAQDAPKTSQDPSETLSVVDVERFSAPTCRIVSFSSVDFGLQLGG